MQGALDLPNNQKFDPVVLVQNAEGQDEVKIDPIIKGETLTAKVPLKYKHNRVKVLLSNAWNDPALAAELQVQYLRPPRILEMDAPKQSDKPLVDVSARVHSVLKVSREQVDAEVNGRDIARDRIQVQNLDANTWKVQLKHVPLDPAKNVVHVNVSNAEARSRQPGSATINFVPPASERPPPTRLAPRVELLTPAPH